MQKQNCGFAACNLGSRRRQTVWSCHPPRKYRPRRFADEISGLAPDNKGPLIHLLHEIWNHDFNFRNNSLSVRSQCLTDGSQFEGEFRSSSRRSVSSCITFISRSSFLQFGTWHYGTNGPPYNGFGRIARWQCDKVTFSWRDFAKHIFLGYTYLDVLFAHLYAMYRVFFLLPLGLPLKS